MGNGLGPEGRKNSDDTDSAGTETNTISALGSLFPGFLQFLQFLHLMVRREGFGFV